MSKRTRPTEAEYAALSADYVEHPITPDEVVSVEVTLDPVTLKKGRPANGHSQGESPVLSIRFPDDLRRRITARAAKDGTAAADVVRRAVVEYLNAS